MAQAQACTTVVVCRPGKARGRPFAQGGDHRQYQARSGTVPPPPSSAAEKTAAGVLQRGFESGKEVAPLTAAERRQEKTGGRTRAECAARVRKGNPEGELLCCKADDCFSAWHSKCLGLSAAPFGRWECPCCVLAPGKACMPRWPTAPPRSGKRAKAPRTGQYLSDSDAEGEVDDE